MASAAVIPTTSHLASTVLGTDMLDVGKLFDVDGWVAIVTGGGTGLGLITASTLAHNGARVYITGRRAEVLNDAAAKANEALKKSANEQSRRGEVVPFVGDVSNKEGIAALREFVQSKEKYINLLVNNHGVSESVPDINDCPQTPEGISEQMFNSETVSRWLSTYQTNTASYYFTTFAFLPLLAAAKEVGGFPERGNVICVSSMSGMTKTSQRGQFNYNASKAATISLSNQLATEFARRDLFIRVNCICPGYFPSGMTPINPTTGTAQEFREGGRGAMKPLGAKGGGESGAGWGIPFARPGDAVDYAQTLLGIVCNKYMTGAEIVVDGGWLLESAF